MASPATSKTFAVKRYPVAAVVTFTSKVEEPLMAFISLSPPKLSVFWFIVSLTWALLPDPIVTGLSYWSTMETTGAIEEPAGYEVLTLVENNMRLASALVTLN